MATITFDQTTLSPAGVTNRSRSDGLINGSEVTITVNEPGIVAFIDVPEGDTNSVSSLQQVSPLIWKFTPTAGVYGSWLVEFKPTAVENQPVRRIFAVRSPSKALRIPAFNEHASSKATVANGASLVDSSDNNEGGSYRGWAPTLAELYKTVVSAPIVLTSNLTVYVDSAAGNDTNAGTQAAPFKTVQRAFDERGNYIVRNAAFVIQLIGVGPYALPAFASGWLSYDKGCTVIRGDNAAVTVYATGTATSGFGSTSVLTTAAGLGVDTHKGRFVRFTSGANVGCIGQICEHTDASITFCALMPFAVASGDTFEIMTPGSQLSGTCTISDIRAANVLGVFAALIFELVYMTGTFVLDKATALALACRFAGTLFLQDAWLASYNLDAAFIGKPKSTYAAGGIMCASVYCYGASYLQVAFVTSGNVSFLDTTTAALQYGGRFGGVVTVGPCAVMQFLAVNGTAMRFDRSVVVSDGGYAKFTKSTNGLGKFAVTTGDCIRVQTEGCAYVQTSPTGGTTDAAGFAVNTTGGGKFLTSVALAFTGGTAGKDLRTSGNGGVANSVLSAAGTAAGSAADALLGEVLARI